MKYYLHCLIDKYVKKEKTFQNINQTSHYRYIYIFGNKNKISMIYNMIINTNKYTNTNEYMLKLHTEMLQYIIPFINSIII